MSQPIPEPTSAGHLGLASVRIDYTNYRGERGIRTVLPGLIYFGSAPPRHPGPEWLMEAWDHEKEAARTFAMKDIHSWEPFRP